MRLALGLAYDGTDFQGYQTQPGGQTIQDHLESAIGEFLDMPSHLVETTAAGRTDAGVHATGQVVHLDTLADRPPWNWVRGLNTFLPQSIRVRWVAEAPAEFHARFSAIRRSYTYRIYNSPVDCPLHQRFATWVFQPLDLDRMQQAAACLVGEHDFSAFRAAECQAASPIRRLDSITWERQGSLLLCHLEGNAFLHHMVRNLVGSLAEIGRGARPLDWMAELLCARDRSLAARTYPPQGLCLTGVAYDTPLVRTPDLSLTPHAHPN